MSKLDALLVALVLVGTVSGIVISAMIVLGLGALLTIMIAIGIYLFEKHYLN